MVTNPLPRNAMATLAESSKYMLIADRFARLLDDTPADQLDSHLADFKHAHTDTTTDIINYLALYIAHRYSAPRSRSYREIADELAEATDVKASYEALRRWHHTITSSDQTP